MARNPTATSTVSPVRQAHGRILVITADGDGMQVLLKHPDGNVSYRLSRSHENYSTLASAVLAAHASGSMLSVSYIGGAGRAPAGISTPASITALAFGVEIYLIGETSPRGPLA